MDHVFRDFSVREHISRQATSAAEARAEQVDYGQWKEIQGLVELPTFSSEAERCGRTCGPEVICLGRVFQVYEDLSTSANHRDLL